MGRYIFKRVVIAILTMFVLATITFFLVKILPGNPFLNEKVPKEVQQRQREYYGLDKPIFIQYLTYISKLVRGDLGTSLKFTGRKVTTIISETFPVSAVLGLAALIVSELTGTLFGILSAQNKNKIPDYLLMIVAILGITLPSMVVGPLLRYAFSVKLRLLPLTGWGTLKQAILPVFVMSLAPLASSTRGMRASMLGVTTQDYIKTARSKGLSPFKVVMRHQLKNSLIPVVTNLGPAVAVMIMGSFVVEQIFVIPGLGKHFVNAVTTLDYPMVMGLTIFYGAFLVTMTLLVDIVYGFIDPRIRLK